MRTPRFSDYEVVSFDMFDTLVSRLVCSPGDVFALVESRTGEGGFAKARVSAEHAARSRGKSEITLDDVYAELAGRFSQDQVLSSLKLNELQVERDVCVANNEGKRLFEAAKASGARIVVTSDMYLPSSFLEEILHSCGYKGWERLFVSCECGATKASGSLYSLLTRELRVKPARVLHIGDNQKSDLLRARQNGVAARRFVRNYSNSTSLEESFVLAAQASRHGSEVSDPSFLEDFGYSCLGPILVGFCEWLIEELKKEGIARIYYLSRDGLIVQRTMKELGAKDCAGTYLHVSRRALQAPSIALLDGFDEIIDSMFLPKTISLRKLFYKMGLDGEAAAIRMIEKSINPDIQRDSQRLAEDEEVVRAYRLLSSDVHENAEEAYGLLVSYLKQNEFCGKVAIVDIGWFGNMQLALERICVEAGIDAEIYGYYVGLTPEGKNQLTHSMKGYLFDAQHGLPLFEREHCYNFLFETLFSATHGTTLGYRTMDLGNIIPVLAEYEGPEELVGAFAEKARNGALQFANDWARVIGARSKGIDPELAQRSMSRVGVKPTLSESLYFGGWVMEADGGLIYASRPQSVLFYIIHPKQFVRDFSQTSWKPGFMKQLMKVPLPYGAILIHIRRAIKWFYQQKPKLVGRRYISNAADKKMPEKL